MFPGGPAPSEHLPRLGGPQAPPWTSTACLLVKGEGPCLVPSPAATWRRFGIRAKSRTRFSSLALPQALSPQPPASTATAVRLPAPLRPLFPWQESPAQTEGQGLALGSCSDLVQTLLATPPWDRLGNTQVGALGSARASPPTPAPRGSSETSRRTSPGSGVTGPHAPPGPWSCREGNKGAGPGSGAHWDRQLWERSPARPHSASRPVSLHVLTGNRVKDHSPEVPIPWPVHHDTSLHGQPWAPGPATPAHTPRAFPWAGRLAFQPISWTEAQERLPGKAGVLHPGLHPAGSHAPDGAVPGAWTLGPAKPALQPAAEPNLGGCGPEDTGQAQEGGGQGDGSGCSWRGRVSSIWQCPAFAASHLGKTGIWGSLEVIQPPDQSPCPPVRKHLGCEASAARPGQRALIKSVDLAGPQTHEWPSDQQTCIYWEPAES